MRSDLRLLTVRLGFVALRENSNCKGDYLQAEQWLILAAWLGIGSCWEWWSVGCERRGMLTEKSWGGILKQIPAEQVPKPVQARWCHQSIWLSTDDTWRKEERVLQVHNLGCVPVDYSRDTSDIIASHADEWCNPLRNMYRTFRSKYECHWQWRQYISAFLQLVFV